MTRHLPFLALLALLGATACSPCVERCRVESRKLDPCLGEWGLEWADFGTESAKTFRESCVEDQQRWLNSLESEGRSDANSLCAELNSELRSAASCEEVSAALQDWPEMS